MKVLLQDVIDAIESAMDENLYFYYIPEEKIILYSELNREWYCDFELPEDIDDMEDDLIALPSQYERNDYHIMEQYIVQVTDETAYKWLENSIHGRGAFRNFRATLNRFGLTSDWYAFKDKAYREIAIEWCNTYGIAFDNSNIIYDEEEDIEYLEPNEDVIDLRIVEIDKRNLANILYMVAEKNAYLNGLKGNDKIEDLEEAEAELESFSNQEIHIFAVSKNGRYVGYTLTVHERNALLLHTIYVREDQRREGIGTMLLEHVEKLAEQEHLQFITPSQPNDILLQSFLKSRQYEIVEYILSKVK